MLFGVSGLSGNVSLPNPRTLDEYTPHQYWSANFIQPSLLFHLSEDLELESRGKGLHLPYSSATRPRKAIPILFFLYCPSPCGDQSVYEGRTVAAANVYLVPVEEEGATHLLLNKLGALSQHSRSQGPGPSPAPIFYIA